MLGIKEVNDRIWLVSFMHFGLGFIHLKHRTLQTIQHSVRHVSPVLR